MSIVIRRNFGDLSALKLTAPELMREIGLMAARLIRTRPEHGLDVHGAAFQSLSDGYAKQKQKALGHSRADLQVSGRMLNDMQVTEVTENRATIGFISSGAGSSRGTFIQRSRSVGANDKAFFHNEVGAGKSQVIREFFDLSEADADQIETAVDAYLEKMLQHA